MAPFSALLLVACAYRPPLETPALVAAEGPVRTIALPEGEPLRLALRAGSAHDPPGREGLAWVTAHAVADAAGATVEVGPDIVVFTVPYGNAQALAAALATAPTPERVAAARDAAATALADLDCAALAARAWDAWIYAGHPYGHAPEGRLSVLPTITPAEVAGFQQVRYVRSVAALGVAAEVRFDPAVFATLPPKLSASPVPATTLPLPAARTLVVRAEGKRCLVAGHPAAGGDARVEAALAPGDVVFGARRQARRLASLPVPPERSAGGLVADVLGGGWLPAWQASRALAPEATVPAARALTDALLAQDPWPALARPVDLGHRVAEADVVTAPVAPPPLDAALAAWLTPPDMRAVLVLPPDAPADLESLGAPVVQPEVTFPELFR